MAENKPANDDQPKKGRPAIFTQDMGNEIARRLSNGESLRAICRDEGMPAESTVRAWALLPEHPFYAQYTRAREIGYHSMADELLDISDDGSNDWMEREGRTLENGEAIARSRLRVDTRKWMLSRVLPKIYGDKIVHQGDEKNPIHVVNEMFGFLNGTGRGLAGRAEDETSEDDETPRMAS